MGIVVDKHLLQMVEYVCCSDDVEDGYGKEAIFPSQGFVIRSALHKHLCRVGGSQTHDLGKCKEAGS